MITKLKATPQQVSMTLKNGKELVVDCAVVVHLDNAVLITQDFKALALQLHALTKSNGSVAILMPDRVVFSLSPNSKIESIPLNIKKKEKDYSLYLLIGAVISSVVFAIELIG